MAYLETPFNVIHLSKSADSPVFQVNEAIKNGNFLKALKGTLAYSNMMIHADLNEYALRCSLYLRPDFLGGNID